MIREEAMERIKTRFDKWALDNEDMKAIQTLIPELRESEDERIRKWILEKVQGYADSGIPCPDEIQTANKALAWLEKQKEQDECPEYCVKSHCMGCSIYEKQKDQKPEEKTVNWTELTWEDIVELEGIINNVHYEFHNGIGRESFGKEVLERFRSTKGIEYLDEAEQKYWREEGQKEQKPQGVYVDCTEHPEWYGMPPKEQKPAEWSELDKLTLDSIVSIVEDWESQQSEEEKEYYGATQKSNWLKSLRPRLSDEEIKKIRSEEYTKGFNDAAFGGKAWKPSEEQMKALLNAEGYLWEGDQFDSAESIMELYEQLKKLM